MEQEKWEKERNVKWGSLEKRMITWHINDYNHYEPTNQPANRTLNWVFTNPGAQVKTNCF